MSDDHGYTHEQIEKNAKMSDDQAMRVAWRIHDALRDGIWGSPEQKSGADQALQGIAKTLNDLGDNGASAARVNEHLMQAGLLPDTQVMDFGKNGKTDVQIKDTVAGDELHNITFTWNAHDAREISMAPVGSSAEKIRPSV